MAAREKAREKSEKASVKSQEKGSEKTKGTKSTPGEELRLGQLLGSACLLDIEVGSKEELIAKLCEAIVREKGFPEAERIFEAAMERESVVNTYLGEGVAAPHARVPGFDGFAIAIARNAKGFPYGVETPEPVQIAIFLVGNEALQDEHVRCLAAIASVVKDKNVRQEIIEAPDVQTVAKILDAGTGLPTRRKRPPQLSKLLLSHAQKIAKEVGATAVLVALENPEELSILKKLPRRENFIVATRSAKIADSAEKIVRRVIRLPRTPLRRDTLVRLGALMGVSNGFISRGDVVAFLSGHPDTGLDTITVLVIWREFGRLLTASGEISPKVSPGVLERVLTLASELATEGREGRAIGTIFVIGEPEELAPYCQQLIVNPFRGYPEKERNILDPTLRETVKEFASIDGAFIVKGNGVVHAAGTYLKPGNVEVDLPSGYGTRHRAACAITTVCDCISITISESTGQVMLFRKGAAILTTEKHTER